MSFDWSEYLTLAQELTSASTSSPIQEAHLRAAVSRAYYAAFCKARNYLHNKDGYLTPKCFHTECAESPLQVISEA